MRETPSNLARRVAWWLFAGGVTLYMVLSAQGLYVMGIHYEAPGGAFFEKLHPGTWLIVAAYLLLLMAHGNPIRVVGAQFAAQPLLAVYLSCHVLMITWTLSRYGVSGAAFFIDTLVMSFVCIWTVTMLDSRRHYQCLVLIVSLLVLNSMLGLGEVLLQKRLIPLTLGGAKEMNEEIFRPSALLGHPLTNSMITATLLPAVLYLRIPMAWRGVLMLMLWIGTLAFGGRTAFVLATLAYGLYFPLQVARAALKGRFSYVQLTGGALAVMLAAALLIIAIMVSGIGERIFTGLTWDSSAQVRARVWDVLDYMSPEDMLSGVSPADITALGQRIGLAESEAIENFWLVMFLQLGWVGFVPYIVAMGCATVWLWRSSRGAMRLSVLLFFAIASSNNSLTTKCIVFVVFVIVVAITRRLPVPGESGPAPAEAPAPGLADGSVRPWDKPASPM